MPSLQSLGQASAIGKPAVKAAQPDGQAPEPVRQADARAGAEPGDRAARAQDAHRDRATRAARSNPTRAAPTAARATRASKACSSTSSTSPTRSTTSARTVTCSASTRSPTRRAARTRPRRRSPTTSTPTRRASSSPTRAAATRSWGQTSPASTRPDPANPSACVPDPGGVPGRAGYGTPTRPEDQRLQAPRDATRPPPSPQTTREGQKRGAESVRTAVDARVARGRGRLPLWLELGLERIAAEPRPDRRSDRLAADWQRAAGIDAVARRDGDDSLQGRRRERRRRRRPGPATPQLPARRHETPTATRVRESGADRGGHGAGRDRRRCSWPTTPTTGSRSSPPAS